jgi:nicotinate-nucleotide adenylyltransferase
MIRLAINNSPDFEVDLREIERNTPSYMVDTLESFRLEYPNASITLIIGYDAFISLPRWHQWEKLITLANILVINRNEFAQQSMPKSLNSFLAQHQSKNKDTLLNQKAGIIFLFDAGHYEISSTTIRDEIKRKEDVALKLPENVLKYIKDEQLYQ